MKRLLLLLVVLGAGSLAHALSPIYITPDVPTVIPAGPTLLPWTIYRYSTPGPVYAPVLVVLGNPFIDGIHKMDAFGDWLISVDAPSNLTGLLAPPAQPRDVIRYDGALYSFFFCPSQDPALNIPPGVNLDALYLEGGDQGSLVVSFDVPIQLPPGGPFYGPADLVRFDRITGGVGCGSAAWLLSGANPVFGGIPPNGINLIGADGALGLTIFSLDVPAILTPTTDPTPPFFTRDELVSWDGVTYARFEPLIGWPQGSEVDGLSCLANPGTVPVTITLDKATPVGCDLCNIIINWSPSCSEGGEDYGIYQGTIGTWYSHSSIVCTDTGANLTETLTPGAGNRYYLVVAHNAKAEGSYGNCSAGFCGAGDQRPVGGAACVVPQVITPCP